MRHSGAPKKINNEGRAKTDKQTEHTQMQVNANWKEKNIRFHAMYMQAAFKPQSPRYLIWTPFGAMTSLRTCQPDMAYREEGRDSSLCL